MIVDPPEQLKVPLKVIPKILLGPGPSNPSPAIYEAMSQPLLAHLHPSFLKIMDEVKLGLQYVFQTKNPYTFAITGTGHAGLEAALVNLLEPGDKVLIAENGLWGERAAETATRIGANVTTLVKPPGYGFTFEEIEQALKKHKPVVLFMCHGESTTGVMQPLEGLGDLCHIHNCLFLVDAVVTMGGVAFSADKLNIDCVYSASQKILGCPPGLAPITFGANAIKKVLDRKTKPSSVYFDVKLSANYWGCDGEPREYHHTRPINLIYGLRAALAGVVKEGLEKMHERHKQSAQRLYDGLKRLGLEVLVKDPEYRLPTLTAVLVPKGVDWKKVKDHLFVKYDIHITGGGTSPTVGKIWRIGLMGHNSTFETVDKCLAALKDAISVAGS